MGRDEGRPDDVGVEAQLLDRPDAVGVRRDERQAAAVPRPLLGGDLGDRRRLPRPGRSDEHLDGGEALVSGHQRRQPAAQRAPQAGNRGTPALSPRKSRGHFLGQPRVEAGCGEAGDDLDRPS